MAHSILKSQLRGMTLVMLVKDARLGTVNSRTVVSGEFTKL
jgi:hypothetical protein